MCKLCNDVRHNHPGYHFCPHCGTNLKYGFVAPHMIQRVYNDANLSCFNGNKISTGLYTDTVIDIGDK